jgi:tetratricopeptide (TPR) repeat protein
VLGQSGGAIAAYADAGHIANAVELATENWDVAIAALNLAVPRDPLNADIQNYIGYAHAQLAQLGPAMGHYQRALMLNPRHRGARTHLGELFLMLDESLKAREQLAALKEICLIPCEEIAHLERAIDAGTGRPSMRE